MDKITIERETVELAASLIQPLTGKGDREVYDALRAALAAQPAPAAVPPGYALVPIEPTPEMCKIGGHVMSEWTDDSAPLRERTYAVAFADAYRAMVAAAGDKP